MGRRPQEFEQHPSPFPGGEFRAVCRHVVDGDTLDALVDLGFNQYGYTTIRLRGVNTPETRTSDEAEKVRGFAARDRTRALVEGKAIVIRTTPDPVTFGRYVAEVSFHEQGAWRDLGQVLLQEGHAVVSRA
ncbi:MAG TPA: thermonuclease family protein [Longimicrobiaceae bacterium]